MAKGGRAERLLSNSARRQHAPSQDQPKFSSATIRSFSTSPSKPLTSPTKYAQPSPSATISWQDDYVGFFLDTFNDKRKAFEAFFNPLGIQGDGILTEGRGEDFSVDLLMESKGIVHETGFNVEIAIPFKSLRFEAGKGKLWGAHFFRRIKRFENELDSWMPFSRSIDSN